MFTALWYQHPSSTDIRIPQISTSLFYRYSNPSDIHIFFQGMGWLRWVGSLKLQVSFADYSLFYWALLQKKPVIFRSLLIVATPYLYSFSDIHIPQIFTSLLYRYSHFSSHPFSIDIHRYLHTSQIYIPPQQISTSLSYVYSFSIDIYIPLMCASLLYGHLHPSQIYIPPLQIFTSLSYAYRSSTDIHIPLIFTSLLNRYLHFSDTGWQQPIWCRIFTGHFP